MQTTADLRTPVDIAVTTHGRLPGIADYAREKIGGLIDRTHQPVLRARVRVSRHADPADVYPVVAQANLDVNGRPMRVQVQSTTARAAVDKLTLRLKHRLERFARHRGGLWGPTTTNHPRDWRHNSTMVRRRYFPRPLDQRQIVRRKSFTLGPCSVDEAARELELLDYDFHLFTEQGTQQASVLYRAATGYRLAQVKPTPRAHLAPFELPLTISPQPAPRLTLKRAMERLALVGLPFLFFIEMAEGRAFVLYRRYDGHYGLISPAG